MNIREYHPYREEEILSLYNSVGWTAYTDHPDTLRRGFEHSLVTLAAYEDENLAGIVRAVGDGETIIYVQDILVAPVYQRQGIGTALLQAVLGRYPHVRQIVLITDNTEKTVEFYKASGFLPLSEIGCCGFIRA